MGNFSKTIDDVLKELDFIIERSIQENNMLGVFAYLYRRTTFEIKTEINKGTFEDNARMELFDLEFANLYLEAMRDYESDHPVCLSWKISFDARKSHLTILQHLLMGMNAHINYDLGIAASNIMKGKPMKELENDFKKVNEILAQLIDEMQDRMGRVSRLMFILDWLAGRYDERLINFNMIKARHNSWEIANELYEMEEEQRKERQRQLDLQVYSTSEMIRNPDSRMLRYSLRIIKVFEQKNIGKILVRLKR